MRFRLRTLLIAIAWFAHICLALRTPSAGWAQVIASTTLLAILTSVLVVIYRRAQTRAFATGFLLFAVSYLALALFFSGGRLGTDAPGDPLRPLAAGLYGQIYGDPMTGGRDLFHLRAFREIIQWGSAMVLGLLGGVIAQWLFGLPQTKE